MAIIVHYVNNKGKLGGYHLGFLILADLPLTIFLEETLIDFCELLGEHSSENMADAVWETLKLFGLIGRVSNSLSC